MYGEPIQALNNALQSMINTLRADPQAADTLWLSMITFDKEVNEIVPLTELANFQLPEIKCPQSGPTHTGLALEMLHNKIETDIKKGTIEQKGDWKPLLFLFTDGKPSDLQLYRTMIPKIKASNFGAIVCCAAGHLADDSLLKELSNDVVHLDNADTAALKQFFKWVSDTIEQGNKSQGSAEVISLPPPPAELNLIV
jgi:uncharacterized protein YegL